MVFTVNVLWTTSVVTATVSGALPLWNATTLLHWVDIGSVKVCAVFPNPHCILGAFGGENYGKYARPLKRFAFIAIQYLLWLWTIPRNPKRWDYRIFICFIGNNSNSHDFTKHQVKSWLPSDLQYSISNIILIAQCISEAAGCFYVYRRARWHRRPRALRCAAWLFRWLRHYLAV